MDSLPRLNLKYESIQFGKEQATNRGMAITDRCTLELLTVLDCEYFGKPFLLEDVRLASVVFSAKGSYKNKREQSSR